MLLYGERTIAKKILVIILLLIEELLPGVNMWEAHEIHESVHVTPQNDLKPHDFNPDCKCGVRYENGVYIHNSYDERELTENLPRC